MVITIANKSRIQMTAASLLSAYHPIVLVSKVGSSGFIIPYSQIFFPLCLLYICPLVPGHCMHLQSDGGLGKPSRIKPVDRAAPYVITGANPALGAFSHAKEKRESRNRPLSLFPQFGHWKCLDFCDNKCFPACLPAFLSNCFLLTSQRGGVLPEHISKAAYFIGTADGSTNRPDADADWCLFYDYIWAFCAINVIC